MLSVYRRMLSVFRGLLSIFRRMLSIFWGLLSIFWGLRLSFGGCCLSFGKFCPAFWGGVLILEAVLKVPHTKRIWKTADLENGAEAQQTLGIEGQRPGDMPAQGKRGTSAALGLRFKKDKALKGRDNGERWCRPFGAWIVYCRDSGRCPGLACHQAFGPRCIDVSSVFRLSAGFKLELVSHEGKRGGDLVAGTFQSRRAPGG